MKDDWDLFSHPSMAIPNAKALLAEILDDGDIVRKGFSPSGSFKSEGLIRWETLRDELRHTNRYFLDEALDFERLSELLDQLIADEIPTEWFRARIASGDVGYTANEMGAPPKHLASHGRANPAGIPYLYLGSKPETAVAEIRPHTGEVAFVADFVISDSLKIADLRNPRSFVSPFIWSDTAVVAQLRADIPFLERLGQELTRPVLPRSAAIDYIPSQYLCEFIKKSGFDGVAYSSSVSSGINLALFDPGKATAGGVRRFDVTRVSVDICCTTPPSTRIETPAGTA
ncbi:RES family NAD+ phosphorylase [Pandoraea iniqua]|uniref:RES family NAD+ phosphorylase n=1 Tax=Pandoraea iniqua TaxID=2508288 RepID=UPI001FEB0430|nr:RES family NAD+ phosphorylase [Pandoraea iniqua]